MHQLISNCGLAGTAILANELVKGCGCLQVALASSRQRESYGWCHRCMAEFLQRPHINRESTVLAGPWLRYGRITILNKKGTCSLQSLQCSAGHQSAQGEALRKAEAYTVLPEQNA